MSCETRRRHVSEASARPTASRNGAPACRRGEDRGAWQCSSIAKRPTDEIPSAFATQDPTFPGYAVLHFTFLRAEVVKVPRLVAPTGESKLSSTSHGHKVFYCPLLSVATPTSTRACVQVLSQGAAALQTMWPLACLQYLRRAFDATSLLSRLRRRNRDHKPGVVQARVGRNVLQCNVFSVRPLGELWGL